MAVIVGRLDRGDRRVETKLIARLAHALGVDLKKILQRNRGSASDITVLFVIVSSCPTLRMWDEEVERIRPSPKEL